METFDSTKRRLTELLEDIEKGKIQLGTVVASKVANALQPKKQVMKLQQAD